MTGNTITTGVAFIGNVIKNVINGEDDVLNLSPDIVAEGKITKLMSSFIYTPNIVVDENLKYMDSSAYKDVVATELKAFSGILVQSFQVMSEIYGVAPGVIVNKMSNPGKLGNYKDIKHIANMVGSENFDYTLDLLVNDGPLPITQGTEASARAGSSVVNNNSIQKDTSIFLTTYEVQLTVTNKDDEDRVIVIPITIYPNIVFTNATSLIDNMVDGDNGKGLFDRIDDYRAGVIQFTDLIFATDLVKKYRDNKIKNDNDFAKYLNSMDKVSGIKDVLYNRKNFYKNFNIYIFSKDVQPTVERNIKGKLIIDKNKDELTDKLSAFSVSFVDANREELTIFLDSIPGFSVLNFNMLKSGKNSEIGDVVKELMKNRQPF